MVEVLNLSRLRTAYLQNSHSVSEKEVLNDVGTMKFTLPCTDEKSRYCQPFHYVRWISDETGETGELYRIIKSTRKSTLPIRSMNVSTSLQRWRIVSCRDTTSLATSAYTP